MGILSGTRPSRLGKIRADGGGYRLQPVKTNLSNAVSSFETSEYHAIAPLAAGNPADTWKRLEQLVRSSPGAEIITLEPGYLYAEFSTRLMGFVDDVEFLLDADNKRIHVRSASRLGRKDFGVNRQRIEALRKRLAQ